MQILQLEKNIFYRIKRGQTAADVEKIFLCPVKENFAGAVVYIEDCIEYEVKPFDNYASIAFNFSLSEEKLKLFNHNKLLYPSKIIYIPRKP